MPIEDAMKEPVMPTRNVVLTDHQAQFVEQLVTTGRYQNASEVLREGLRLVERRESEDAMRLEALRDAAKVGTADIEAGSFRSFGDADSLDSYLATLTSEAIGAEWVGTPGRFACRLPPKPTIVKYCAGRRESSGRRKPAFMPTRFRPR
jgi:antitoxin ParD1/3/4